MVLDFVDGLGGFRPVWLDFVDGLGGFDGIFANFGATEGGEIGAGAELRADVFGERANVSTGADMATDGEFWIIVT